MDKIYIAYMSIYFYIYIYNINIYYYYNYYFNIHKFNNSIYDDNIGLYVSCFLVSIAAGIVPMPLTLVCLSAFSCFLGSSYTFNLRRFYDKSLLYTSIRFLSNCTSFCSSSNKLFYDMFHR